MRTENAIQLLRETVKTSFWGSIEFEFRDGQIALARKTETLKDNSMEKNQNGYGHK